MWIEAGIITYVELKSLIVDIVSLLSLDGILEKEVKIRREILAKIVGKWVLKCELSSRKRKQGVEKEEKRLKMHKKRQTEKESFSNNKC